ncbi:coproporphyrinogen-III oxidase [Kordiimonas sediminis]|uniref:coproporphyrinogen dehydrogenase n=1 Tax=Kordiimonas sediminis TaxID=1735581 RepID=A0A919ATM2_9PROT|nr:coproporphyrinogen-III oxidase [Kordiimonas sediminis]
MGEYLDSLVAEIKAVGSQVAKGAKVQHVHFGGGTPTFLSGDDFMNVMMLARETFTFADDAEVAVEVDPRTLSKDKVDAMVLAGVNRVSIGVQDFNLAVQTKINRVQTEDLVRDSVEWLRDRGIDNISFDLMYGLPGQTEETLVETVSKAVAMSPDRISVFGYAHVPWFKKHQQLLNEEELPDLDARAKQEKIIGDALIAAGYEAIGFDHFAKPEDSIALAARVGSLRRNFQGYTDDPADYLLAFGASAISKLPGGFVQNDPHTGKYRELVAKNGGSGASKGVPITQDDMIRSEIIMTLMCNYHVNITRICEKYGVWATDFEEDLAKLVPLVRDGLCRVKGYNVTVMPAARSLVRVVASAFDGYLDNAQVRHSKAV